MRVLIIVNGARKLRSKAAKAIDLIEEDDALIAERHTTTKAREAVDLVAVHGKTADVILAVGGDGTCNEVINGMMANHLSHIPFGIVPSGTGNDFIRTLSPFDPTEFVLRLKNRQSAPIALGRIISRSTTKWFINIADVGFGGKVIELMDRQRKNGVGGKLSYAGAILRAFILYKKPLLKIRGDGFSYEGPVLMAAFCNGPVFGHGLTIHPDASPFNTTLGVTILGKVSLIDYVKNLGKLKKGKRIIHPEVAYHTVQRITVENLAGDLYAEADGEQLDVDPPGPVEIEVISAAIRLVNEG